MKKFILLFIAVLVFSMQPAFAEVVTTQKTEGYTDYVYVAGNPDNYPVEYYDEKTESYCGIIPDLLTEISEGSGVDFVYINGEGQDSEALSENLQVDIVSSAEGSISDGKGYLELVSYKQGLKTVKCGIAFTMLMDDTLITEIESAVSDISIDERNGIYISYASQAGKISSVWLIAVVALSLLVVILIIVLLVRIKRMKKERETDKMTDAETGMGNLQFFNHHFKYTISDISRSLYHIVYIVLDSSYLRSYHGDSSFQEVLKYASSVLSEYTGDREISARITENGFAMAFQSVNEEDAKNRLKEIMRKLNSFEGTKELSNKLVFHAALYHLGSADKNCELLLFNLRKNCNKIFGTEKEIIYCDVHSMNRIQEEKKITESILKGFEKNEFKMYLQFIVNNKTKKIVSAEALSRWDNFEKGLIGPGQYISNMESAGLISKHDFYMFENACRQLEKWNGTKYQDITISCNFTRITLSEDNFISRLKMISQGYNFDKSRLAIEITEDAIEKDREIAKRNVMFCKKLGFKIYLDDMGSGYTSLSNLCDYPIDVVKIDRDILLKAITKRGRDLFTGIIALAHSLNLSVVCEGVETEEHSIFLSQTDCDFIQGWYYAKPLPLEECELFIENYSSRSGRNCENLYNLVKQIVKNKK